MLFELSKYRSLLLAPFLLAALWLGATERSATPEAVARAVAADLAAGRFAAVTARFAPQVASALPEERLKEVWTSLPAQVGTFGGAGEPRVETVGAVSVVTVPMRFDRVPLDMRVSVDADGTIVGLFFAPAQVPASPWSAPPYASPSAFREEEVLVGRDPWALPGTLTLPAGKTKVPAVVLVHGSGPHDRNETIGPNRPFQDLAWGLASRGVAVLRYEKRTKVHAGKLATLRGLTVREETMDDARAAVSLLRARPEIDSTRVFLLGHSLGGTLAPRIALEEPGLAGLVILAGATRPIPDLMVEQTEYIASLGGEPDAGVRKRIAELKADAARARAAKPGDGPSILGAPPSYWADLNEYDPVEAAKKVKRPMLILQGERDYQVTAKDLARWREALAGRPYVTIRTFADLNHLFMLGKGKGTPTEYDRAGHVAPSVVEAVVAFVKGADLP
jgi:uncharacterized protein